MKIKLVTTVFLTIFLTGCASTSKNGPIDDFFDGAISSAERRNARTPNMQVDLKNELKRDSMSGVATALFRGFLDLFDSSGDEN